MANEVDRFLADVLGDQFPDPGDWTWYDTQRPEDHDEFARPGKPFEMPVCVNRISHLCNKRQGTTVLEAVEYAPDVSDHGLAPQPWEMALIEQAPNLWWILFNAVRVSHNVPSCGCGVCDVLRKARPSLAAISPP